MTLIDGDILMAVPSLEIRWLAHLRDWIGLSEGSSVILLKCLCSNDCRKGTLWSELQMDPKLTHDQIYLYFIITHQSIQQQQEGVNRS